METKSTLSWSHLSAGVRAPSISFRSLASSLGIRKSENNPRLLLQDLTGIAVPGEILAIMGTSGAGKTTLMNVLSGHCGDDVLIGQGQVYVNGILITDSQRQKSGLIGYVEQRDAFIETLRVHEHLTFQAMLGMRRELTDDQRRMHIKNTITQLYLTKCMNTTIQQLSGGEKKRLALASVFLLDSQILLIDEPTTNLDAYLAVYIMKMIRSMAIHRHKTIIVVIHQPTSAMFDLIDKIYLLVRGGRQAFFGSKDEALNFFVSECKLTSSSLDGFIEQLAAPPVKNADANVAIQELVTQQYAQSEQAVLLETIIKQNIESMENNGRIDEIKRGTFGRQLKWLLWRSFIGDFRNSIRSIFMLVRATTLACIFGLLYFQLCGSNYFVQDVSSLDFLASLLVILTSALMILSSMPLNNNIGIRENHRGMYSILAYYLASFLNSLSVFIIIPSVLYSIIYWMSGMDNTWSHYFAFCAVGILSSNLGAALGQAISSFSESVPSSVATAMPIMQILSLFGGFFFNLTHTASVLRFIHYISPFYYSYTILLTLQLTSTGYKHTLHCISLANPLETRTMFSSNISSTNLDLCDHTLQHTSFGNSPGNLGFNIPMDVILLITYHMIAFIIIWYRAHRRELIEYWATRKIFHKPNYQTLP